MYADRINDLCGMFLKGAPYSCIMAMYVLSPGSLNTPLQKMTFVKEGGEDPFLVMVNGWRAEVSLLRLILSFFFPSRRLPVAKKSAKTFTYEPFLAFKLARTS